MSATLTIRDETLTGGVTGEWSLDFLDERITVRDLIRERVYQEVQDHNRRRQSRGAFRGLVQPEAEEREPNGPVAGEAREVDWTPQFDRATEAFEANQILILIDDRQAGSLDETFAIGQKTVVTFVRLALLVGG